MTALLALISGALLPLSLAPFDYWPLGLLSLALWFHVLRRPGAKASREDRDREVAPTVASGALVGWLFGVGKYGLGASWVYVSIHVYGNAPPPLAGFLVVVFVAGLALFTLANGWLFARLRRWCLAGGGHGAVADALLFAALFTGFEWLLTWFLTGFPWLFAGYAHLQTVLAGLAPLGGVLLVGFVVALSAALLTVAAEYAVSRRFAAAAVAAAAILVPWLTAWAVVDVEWVEEVDRRQVALVQGNVDQAIKWLPESREPILDRYRALSDPHWGVDLMIWPEAALTIVAHQAGDVLAQLDARAEAAGTAFVLGMPAIERLPDGGYVFHNAAFALGTGHGRYTKRRLVPFGEYVPLEGLLRGVIDFFDLPMSRSAPGPWRQPLLDLGGHRGVMAICYEVVYPDLVRLQAARADVLLTISNDSWFGASIGPLQHLQMARMRALENGRYVLRGTNNGITAVIDDRGRVTARLPQFEAGTLRGEYVTMAGVTPFTRYGHAPLLAVLAVLVASLMVLSRRRASPPTGTRAR